MAMTCFFSYSWNDDVDEKLLSEIKSQIEKMSNYKIRVIFDKKSFHTGDNIIEKENQIKESDSMVLFFTPSYKSKVIEASEEQGVYREYTTIKNRLENGDKNIIPVLLSGDFENSVPDEFKKIIYEDIRQVRTQIYEKQGNITFSDNLESAIKKISKETIKRTEVYAWLKDNSFDSLDDEYDALFLNYSADPTKKLPRDCIIRTKAYDFIYNQNGYFVIGRKGSGKTTFLDAIQDYNPELYMKKYKTASSITAESINLDYVYKELIKKTKADFNIIPMTRVIDVFWEVFLVLQCIYNIGIELEHFQIEDSDDRITLFENIVDIFKQKIGHSQEFLDDKSPKDSITTASAEMLVNFLNDGIFKLINADTLCASAYNNFTSVRILENEFGKDLFTEFCNAIRRCNKKILLSLDGFDPHSEDFRFETSSKKLSEPEEYLSRKDFEVLFYRELIITISNLKQGIADNSIARIFNVVDFCIIIPRDRFDEIKDNYRDRDIAKRRYCSLSWDAYDLLEMLIKRLEYHYRIESDEEETNLLTRFNNIIKKELPSIPENMTIEIDGFDMPIPTFIYILRLSFWRPRDIIRSFAVVMSMGKRPVPQSQEAVQGILKTLLTNNTREIINEEFIGEYNCVYANFEGTIKKFRNFDFIVDFGSFYEKLSKIEIESIYDISTRTVQEKFELLYKLGVVGIYLDKKVAEHNGYGHHTCFVFNEGTRPWDDLKELSFEELRAKVIFNPIFLKCLDLQINTKELICNFTWDYIYKNHLMKDSIHRI